MYSRFDKGDQRALPPLVCFLKRTNRRQMSSILISFHLVRKVQVYGRRKPPWKAPSCSLATSTKLFNIASCDLDRCHGSLCFAEDNMADLLIQCYTFTIRCDISVERPKKVKSYAFQTSCEVLRGTFGVVLV